MCYNVKALLESQLKRARRSGYNTDADAIQLELEYLGKGNYNHISGFAHPNDLVIYTGPAFKPKLSTWGLIPDSFKKEDHSLWWKQFNTLNAKIETMFNSPAYAKYAEKNHCLIYVDGFYEFHHIGKDKYPFFIQAKNNEPIPLAGLWSEWENPSKTYKILTFSIVTTIGNNVMSKIHNVHPQSETPRQPVIMNEEMANQWIVDGFNQNTAKKFREPFPQELLTFHPVGQLTGKGIEPNSPKASEKREYEELNEFLDELSSK